RGEKESEYAHRLAGEMRLLKRRVTEAGYSEAEATWRVTIYEELGVENLRRNVSEPTRLLKMLIYF
ncbi:hypothetical protein, partial [Klebsiella pneumoniae]|uniref:hypothetical protein n=1 Tax=Klebsiella pneumoniae TaxID=573 RepID=UPI00405546B0